MNYGGKVVKDIESLIRLFLPHCQDRQTLDQLLRMLSDRSKFVAAHHLFGQIRSKTLKAEKSKDQILGHQYLFEEICAKTLYNLSGEPAPFDADSPYWIIPNALSLSRALGLADSEVIKLISD